MGASSTMCKTVFLKPGHLARRDGLWYVGTRAHYDRIDAEAVR
jgi:hypothetical protein